MSGEGSESSPGSANEVGQSMRQFLTLGLAAWLFVGLGVASNEDVRLSGIPAAKLPKHVVAAPGKLTLFADFMKKSDLGVPLYLVNRTGKVVELPTYLGQPLLTMEYEAAPGKWKPAAYVNHPLCGNSLRTSELPDKSFGQGYDSTRRVGLKAKVRYRYDDRCVSNAGEGVVSRDDLNHFKWVEENEARRRDR
jgi:hypothetical protein